TPSASSRRRWVIIPLIRARRLIPPDAFTTRCHGMFGGHSRMAWPTARAPRGRPSESASWPYVTTCPRGMRRTSCHTRFAKLTRGGCEPTIPRGGRRGLRYEGGRRVVPARGYVRDAGRGFDRRPARSRAGERW